MKKAMYFLLLSALILSGCSKPVKEEQHMIRLPAETAEQEKTAEYVYLEKMELRNEDVIARPYFFIDGNVNGNQVSYSGFGLTANLSLLKANTINLSSRLSEEKEIAMESITSQSNVIGEIETKEKTSMIEISYLKEITGEEDDKTVSYRYPCKWIIWTDTLADGNYLLISLAIDNEKADQMTENLLMEFLDAYGISFD